MEGGNVILENTIRIGGTQGGTFQVADFAIAKYPITNAQYKEFLKNSNYSGNCAMMIRSLSSLAAAFPPHESEVSQSNGQTIFQ